jgi:hypothetical protein
VEAAATTLVKAIDASDLDAIDSYASWLGANATAAELRRLLGPPVAPSLAAAAHAPIGLHLLGRTPEIDGSVLRGALREVGRQPEWLVETDGKACGDAPLLEVLLDLPRLGMPGSNFIFPMVTHGAETASQLLADVSRDPTDGARAVSRVAAWSMLQDAEEHAPYGWTHTLTIPQGVMSLHLDPRLAVAVAASQVIGFRASMGTVVLDPYMPVPTLSKEEAVRLVVGALLHHDAHLVKYTLACLDAASTDPNMANLYLAAAAHLAAWWERQKDDRFFEGE